MWPIKMLGKSTRALAVYPIYFSTTVFELTNSRWNSILLDKQMSAIASKDKHMKYQIFLHNFTITFLIFML